MFVFANIPQEAIMQIFVKPPNNRTMTLNMKASDTIINMRAKIRDKSLYYVHFRLEFGGKELDNDKTLSHYNIKDESTIWLVPSKQHFQIIFLVLGLCFRFYHFSFCRNMDFLALDLAKGVGQPTTFPTSCSNPHPNPMTWSRSGLHWT